MQDERLGWDELKVQFKQIKSGHRLAVDDIQSLTSVAVGSERENQSVIAFLYRSVFILAEPRCLGHQSLWRIETNADLIIIERTTRPGANETSNSALYIFISVAAANKGRAELIYLHVTSLSQSTVSWRTHTHMPVRVDSTMVNTPLTLNAFKMN